MAGAGGSMRPHRRLAEENLAMNLRLTGILALIAALLGILIVFWDRDEDSTRARLEQARRAFRFDPARVDGLLIESGDLSIECRLDEQQWRLVRPITARADSVAITRLLGALQELPRGDILFPARRTENPYAPYGLDDPRATIAVISGQTTNRMFIGRRTPLGDGLYVRQSDHTGLARLQTSLLDLLPTGPDVLRDRTLLIGSAAGIDRLEIRSGAGYLQLARQGNGAWRIYQPFTARADAASINQLIAQLMACTVVQFVQDGVADLTPYGLDSRQNAITVAVNLDSGAGLQMLSLGDPLPNAPERCYARLQAENSVYAVPIALRQALQVKPDDLRDRRLPPISPEDIQRIQIEDNGNRLEWLHDSSLGWQLTAPLQAPANPEAVQQILRQWTDVRLTAFIPPSSPTTNSAKPRTIRLFSRNESAPLTIQISAPTPPTNAMWVAIEGDLYPALAAPTDLLTMPLNPLAFRSRDVLSIPAADIVSMKLTTNGTTIHTQRDPATGQWTPDAPWLPAVLAMFNPLQAEEWLENTSPQANAAWNQPWLTVELGLREQSGLSISLLVAEPPSPDTAGAPQPAMIRGRELLFTLSPATLETLMLPFTPE